MIMLWLKRLRNNWWVCSGRSPQYLVVYYSFSVEVLRIMEDSILLLIFDRRVLVLVIYNSVVT